MLEHEHARKELAAMIERLKLTITSEFVPWSKSRYHEATYPSLNWKVTIKRDGRDVLTTDYMAGQAHAPAYKRLELSVNDRKRRSEWECENGYPAFETPDGRLIRKPNKPAVEPGLVDVISSLAMDSDVLEYATFEDWASNFGYDADSRKAEATYRLCLDHALKFRAAVGEAELSAMREHAHRM